MNASLRSLRPPVQSDKRDFEEKNRDSSKYSPARPFWQDAPGSDEVPSGDVTRLLHQWQQGDSASFDQLSGLLYNELHRIAVGYLRNSPNSTLQPTALINEAYLRMVGVDAPLKGRKHFFALAAKLMRQILVDRVRRHSASKRGAGSQVEELDEANHGAHSGIEEFLILDQALSRLAEEEPRLAQIVELRYFGGLSGPEISELLGLPVWSVHSNQRLAEAWLRRALSQA
jgi:RNA polymerase sigma factor (TIGR02999 family)